MTFKTEGILQGMNLDGKHPWKYQNARVELVQYIDEETWTLSLKD